VKWLCGVLKFGLENDSHNNTIDGHCFTENNTATTPPPKIPKKWGLGNQSLKRWRLTHNIDYLTKENSIHNKSTTVDQEPESCKQYTWWGSLMWFGEPWLPLLWECSLLCRYPWRKDTKQFFYHNSGDKTPEIKAQVLDTKFHSQIVSSRFQSTRPTKMVKFWDPEMIYSPRWHILHIELAAWWRSLSYIIKAWYRGKRSDDFATTESLLVSWSAKGNLKVQTCASQADLKLIFFYGKKWIKKNTKLTKQLPEQKLQRRARCQLRRTQTGTCKEKHASILATTTQTPSFLAATAYVQSSPLSPSSSRSNKPVCSFSLGLLRLHLGRLNTTTHVRPLATTNSLHRGRGVGSQAKTKTFATQRGHTATEESETLITSLFFHR
jgi:hypothetical protein